jgi:hypothetical protein
MLHTLLGLSSVVGLAPVVSHAAEGAEGTKPAAGGKDFVYMPGLEGKNYGKPRMTYSDFTMTPSGLQYREVRVRDIHRRVGGDGADGGCGGLLIMVHDGFAGGEGE